MISSPFPSLRGPARALALAAPLALLAACTGAGPIDTGGPALLDGPISMTQLAVTIAVPGDHATIGAALAAASEGDVVAVGPGVWTGDLTLPGGVFLQGAGLDETIIDGRITVAGGQGGVALLNVEGPGASAGTCGVTVTNGNSVLVTAARVLGFYEGICLDPGNALTVPYPVVDRVTLQSNGYAVSVYSGEATVTNSYVVYSIRSGIYGLPGATVNAVNNTLIGNSFGGNETDRDAAVSLGLGGDSVVRNNIVSSNLFGLQCDECVVAADHNNVWGNTTNYAGDSSAASSDLGVDPLFVSPTGGNLRLLDTSPVIDMGSSDGAPDHDWDGLARPSGAGFDMGADEWTLSTYSLVINEVMANPTVESTGEFIEIANVGSEPVDLADLIVGDGDSLDVIQEFNSGTTVVPGGGFAVVVDADYAGQYAIPGGAVVVTVGNATLGNGLSTNDPIQLVEPNGYVVIDEWSIPFNPGDGVSVERVDVLSGNVTSNWVASPCPLESSPGEINCAAGEIADNDPSVLVITEILANALNEQTGEFVELWNSGEEDVDLTGLVIYDGDSTDGLVAWGGGDTILPGGAYALIVDPSYASQYLIPAATLLMTTPDATIGNGLANGSDPITLFDQDGVTVIDEYAIPQDYGDGVSIEKLDYALGDVFGNWGPSTCPINHSAGRLSCWAGGVGDGLVLNEVMNNPLNEQTGEFLELVNLRADPIDLAGLWISDGDQDDMLVAYQGGPTELPGGAVGLVIDSGWNGDYVIPAGAVVMTTGDNHLGNGLSLTDPITLYESDGSSVVDSFSEPFNPGNGISVEKISVAGGDEDVNWDPSSCASGSSPGQANCLSYVPIPAGSSTLVVTEIMSNPLVESTGEYVELYNDGVDPVDLWGLILYDGDAWDFVREFQSGSTIVNPGEYAVIVDTGYPGNYPIPAGVTVVTVDDATLGSGLATNDPVSLYEADGYSQIDSFTFPFNPGNGVSVERVDLTAGDIAANWVSSPCDLSPGEENCSASTVISACDDGIDNDGDGWIDLVDPGCASAVDNDEVLWSLVACADETDNDNDGLIDGNDPDCADPTDTSEAGPCFDSVDNDNDGWTDDDDPDCYAAPFDEVGFSDLFCNDNIDNNDDGNTDAADADCWDADSFEVLPLGAIIVTEVMNDPDAVDDTVGEWFELYNTLSVDVQLENWNLYDGGGDNFDIVGSLIVPAGGYVVFANNGNPAVNGGVVPDYVYSPADMTLDNVDDEIYLDDFTLTEHLIWEWYELDGWPDVTGASWGIDGALTPSASSMYDEASWCGSTVPWSGSAGDAGSPGEPNEGC